VAVWLGAKLRPQQLWFYLDSFILNNRGKWLQQDVALLEVVLAAFEMRLPDQVDEIDMVERADNGFEERLAFFLGLTRRQGGDAIEHYLVHPRLVPRAHARGRKMSPAPAALAPDGSGFKGTRVGLVTF
jgi:hypothetical protein